MFEYVIGTPEIKYHDSIHNQSQWTTNENWNLTRQCRSEPLALTDSPDRLYQNYSDNSLFLSKTVSLANLARPWLEFWTKWDIEPNYDFATVNISTNNGLTWDHLKGNHAKRASGFMPVQSDTSQFGYDSVQSEWIKETISLRDYENQDSVIIQFRLQTDGWIIRDGWYIDDISVIGIPVVNYNKTHKSAFILNSNYPNPFNPSTTIGYELNNFSRVTLKIYNVLGQEVRTLVNKPQSKGIPSVIWDGKNERGERAGSGVYFYRLQTGDFVKTKKMMLVK